MATTTAVPGYIAKAKALEQRMGACTGSSMSVLRNKAIGYWRLVIKYAAIAAQVRLAKEHIVALGGQLGHEPSGPVVHDAPARQDETSDAPSSPSLIDFSTVSPAVSAPCAPKPTGGDTLASSTASGPLSTSPASHVSPAPVRAPVVVRGEAQLRLDQALGMVRKAVERDVHGDVAGAWRRYRLAVVMLQHVASDPSLADDMRQATLHHLPQYQRRMHELAAVWDASHSAVDSTSAPPSCTTTGTHSTDASTGSADATTPASPSPVAPPGVPVNSPDATASSSSGTTDVVDGTAEHGAIPATPPQLKVDWTAEAAASTAALERLQAQITADCCAWANSIDRHMQLFDMDRMDPDERKELENELRQLLAS